LKTNHLATLSAILSLPACPIPVAHILCDTIYPLSNKVNVVIFEIISPRKQEKKLAIFNWNYRYLEKVIYHSRKTPIFSLKIGETSRKK
jgi:hypothetical protein